MPPPATAERTRSTSGPTPPRVLATPVFFGLPAVALWGASHGARRGAAAAGRSLPTGGRHGVTGARPRRRGARWSGSALAACLHRAHRRQRRAAAPARPSAGRLGRTGVGAAAGAGRGRPDRGLPAVAAGPARGPGPEVLVLDDGSTDATAALVRAVPPATRGLLRPAARCRPGWLGKPYACQQLAEPRPARVLVFVDADVVLAPHALAGAGGAAARVRPGPASRRTRASSPTARRERLVQPLLQWSWLTFLPLRLAERSARPSLAAANGQFLRGRRGGVRAGPAATRPSAAEVLEDVALLRAVKRAGGRGGRRRRHAVATCRMYDGAGPSSRRATPSRSGPRSARPRGAARRGWRCSRGSTSCRRGRRCSRAHRDRARWGAPATPPGSPAGSSSPGAPAAGPGRTRWRTRSSVGRCSRPSSPSPGDVAEPAPSPGAAPPPAPGPAVTAEARASWPGRGDRRRHGRAWPWRPGSRRSRPRGHRHRAGTDLVGGKLGRYERRRLRLRHRPVAAHPPGGLPRPVRQDRRPARRTYVDLVAAGTGVRLPLRRRHARSTCRGPTPACAGGIGAAFGGRGGARLARVLARRRRDVGGLATPVPRVAARPAVRDLLPGWHAAASRPAHRRARPRRCAASASTTCDDPRLRMLLDRYATYTGSDPRRAPAALAPCRTSSRPSAPGTCPAASARLADALLARGAPRRGGTDSAPTSRRVHRPTPAAGCAACASPTASRLPPTSSSPTPTPPTSTATCLPAPRRTRRRSRRPHPRCRASCCSSRCAAAPPGCATTTCSSRPDYDAEFDAVFGARPQPVARPDRSTSAPRTTTAVPPGRARGVVRPGQRAAARPGRAGSGRLDRARTGRAYARPRCCA